LEIKAYELAALTAKDPDYKGKAYEVTLGAAQDWQNRSIRRFKIGSSGRFLCDGFLVWINHDTVVAELPPFISANHALDVYNEGKTLVLRFFYAGYERVFTKRDSIKSMYLTDMVDVEGNHVTVDDAFGGEWFIEG
jgi:hypothetical protein